MHEVLVNRLGGLSLPMKSVVRLTDRPDMTLDVHRGRKTTMQQIEGISKSILLNSNVYLEVFYNSISTGSKVETKGWYLGVRMFHTPWHCQVLILIIDAFGSCFNKVKI